MKLLASVSAAALTGFFLGVRAETPWFSPKTTEWFSLASSSTTINAGQAIAVTTVPPNKRLVVTDVNVQQVGGVAIHPLQLEERSASGTVTLKVPETILQNVYLYAGVGHSDGHGIVFEPGSEVVFKFNSSAGGSCSFAYFLSGYFAEK